MARFDLTDFEWAAIELHLPNKPRGVPRVDDRRALLATTDWRLGPISLALRAAHDLRQSLQRWRKAGVWERILKAVSEAYDGDIQMIDSTSIRVHQHAVNTQKR